LRRCNDRTNGQWQSKAWRERNNRKLLKLAVACFFRGQINSVQLKGFERHKVQDILVRGSQDNLGRKSRIKGFFPAQGAQTPFIAMLETGEAIFRARRNEVVAHGTRKAQKLISYNRANNMPTCIIGTSSAIAITIEAGKRIFAATFEFAA
jgi:hypothetical protein